MNFAFMDKVDHRPYPMPASRWSVRMQWHQLLFMHWPLPPAAVQRVLPKGLPVDTFDGHAWIGVVPFGMRDVGRRGLPAFPTTGAFPELNVRTYVTLENKPGVYFFSLDAASWIVVKAARASFHLPYHHARMRQINASTAVHYQSVRLSTGAARVAFGARYGPSGPVYTARRGTLDHWLTERYYLYSADADGRIYRGDIHHEPWPLQSGHAEVTENSMVDPTGLILPTSPPVLHYAHRLDVVAWALAPVKTK